MTKIKKQFLRNTITGWLTQLSAAAIGFTLLPLNINHLGKDAYGISVLAVSALAMLNMLDLGMAPALLRFYSQAIAKKEHEHLRMLVSTSLVLLGGLGVLGFSIIVLLSPLFVKFYHIASNMAPATYYLLLCMAISFLLSFISMVYNGLMLASNRYDSVNYLAIASQLLRLGLLYLFYHIMTPSLILLGLAILIGSAANLLVLIVMSNKQLGESSGFLYKYVDKKVLKPLFSFSLLAFINSLFFSASTQIPVMIIGKTLGVNMVTAFFPAVTVSMYLASILSQISSPMVPLASRDLYQNEGNNMGRWATLLGQLVACIGYASVLILVVYGQEILVLWLGQDMAQSSSIPVMILATGVVFGSIQAVNYALALGTSNIAPVAFSSVWMAIVTSIAILLGTVFWHWQLIEVAVCMTVVRFIRNGYYLPYVFSKVFKYNYASYFVTVYIKPAMALLPVLLLGFLFKNHLAQDNTLYLFLSSIVIAPLYAVLCWYLVIEKESRCEIRSIVLSRFQKI